MRNIYQYVASGDYGILDENQEEPRIYWVNNDLSPIWSNYIYGQKSCYFSSVKKECEFVVELDFDYIHVTDLKLNASLE